MSPLFATTEPSTDDAWNAKRIANFRGPMQSLLASRVDLPGVERVLRAVIDASGGWDDSAPSGSKNMTLKRDACNGFYACIACSRHAYRWVTNPVVRVAQEEKGVPGGLPPELEMPWRYLQRRYGITGPSGSVMANVICNLDFVAVGGHGQGHGHESRVAYLVNEGMPAVVLQTELHWARQF